jgi:E3 ubiquitin-protein ligase HECTD1
VNDCIVLVQVSKDGVNWTTLYTHVDDGSLNEPGSTSSWPLEPPTEEVQGWRHVRLQQTGKNASGQTHYLSLSGFEIYGTVTGVCEDLGKAYSTCSHNFLCYEQFFIYLFTFKVCRLLGYGAA